MPKPEVRKEPLPPRRRFPRWRQAALFVVALAIGIGVGVALASLLDDEDKPPVAANRPAPRVARQQNQAAQARVEGALAKSPKEVATATRTPAQLRTSGNVTPARMDEFLTGVFRNVSAYWTRTFQSAGLTPVSVRFHWLAVGERVQTQCPEPGGKTLAVADDNSSFYCPNDDTIYVAQKLASEVWDGAAKGFPGQNLGFGRAVGDFGVAYIVAHEYGHAVQQQLGYRNLIDPPTSKPFELQADCMAGLWGNSVYKQGLLDPGDLEEGISTALALGDFDFYYVDHHGTPTERRRAFERGYNSGVPDVCNSYLTAG